jgi:hypothetical protein
MATLELATVNVADWEPMPPLERVKVAGALVSVGAVAN